MGTLTNVTYVNGIRTSFADADKTKQKLEEITEHPVTLEYNGTTPDNITNQLMTEIAFYSFALIASTIALCKSANAPQPSLSTLLAAGTSGAVVIFSIIKLVEAFEKFQKIQDQKEALAADLAGRISQRLEQNPQSREVLLCHSQGADICKQVIQKLPQHASRIDAVSLGGLEQLPPHPQATRINFAHSHDPVPNLIGHVRLPYDQQEVRACTISQTAQFCLDTYGSQVYSYEILEASGCKTAFCHGVDDYLSHPKVVSAIQNICNQNLQGMVCM